MLKPYMTYDDNAKAIYLSIKKGKYFQSKTIPDEYTKHMINLDYDKDNNLLGIEIIL